MDSYRGRTVLVTGASGGIGEAMARQLARRGARLLLTARSEDRLHHLADELDPEVHIFAHDLGVPGAAQTLYDRIAEAGHAVDVLVNNAGFGKLGPFTATEPEVYEQMLTLNATNLVTLTRLFLPPMLQRGMGGVLTVASTAAFQPVPYFAVYAASKAFVKSFTEALHTEVLASGVHVTCLCPGGTHTGFQARAEVGDDEPFMQFAQTPEAVAEVGLEALLKNERVAVSGTLNQIHAAAAKLAPTSLALAVGRRIMW